MPKLIAPSDPPEDAQIVKRDALPTSGRGNPEHEVNQGDWFWVSLSERNDETGKNQIVKKLGCVIHVGSNYVEFKFVGESSVRLHFDEFWDFVERENDAQTHIDNQIATHWGKTKELMGEIQALTARLGVTGRVQLGAMENTETQALAVSIGNGPIDSYKKDLVEAKKKTLPDLFEKIEEENKLVASWMKAKIIPLKAKTSDMKEVVEKIDDRIFNVELYAGLIETVTKIRKGDPAELGEPIHLMQRRHYMDEECLVGYETGGMDYKNIKDFDAWLTKPINTDRILPFPRCIIAFRIRRERKYREGHSISDYIQIMNEEKWDKTTYLYLRNGDQIFRFETKDDVIQFEEKLFPDQTDRRVLAHGKLWAKMFCDRVDNIITDEEHQGLLEDQENETREQRRYRFRRVEEEYVPFSPASVYHDDIANHVERDAKKQNRLVLILQGLLDRSPVFHPHPPWQLWTQAGFQTGIVLNYDDTRALSAGEKPDFEAYRAKLNSYLKAGSVTVGQEDVWEIREAIKENRHRDNRQYRDGHLNRYRPPGDPGPGRVAVVTNYRSGPGTCSYEWTRKKRIRGWKETREGELKATLTTGEENILNIDAYKPGDFRIFFDDPRTRAEYMKWAPLLLEAEECHAGNRKIDLKAIDTAKTRGRNPVIRDLTRPKVVIPAQAEPPPPIKTKYVGAKVMLNRTFTTRGGSKFKEGEILTILHYYRKKVDLGDPKNKERRISSIEATNYNFTVIEPPPPPNRRQKAR